MSHFEVEEDVVPDVVDAAVDCGPGHGAGGYSLLVPVVGGLRWLPGGCGHLLHLLRAVLFSGPPLSGGRRPRNPPSPPLPS